MSVEQRQSADKTLTPKFLPHFTQSFVVRGPVAGQPGAYILSRTPTSQPFAADVSRLKRVPAAQRGEVPLGVTLDDGVGAGRGAHCAPAVPAFEVDGLVDCARGQVKGTRGPCYLVRFRREGQMADRWFPAAVLEAHGLLPLMHEYDTRGPHLQGPDGPDDDGLQPHGSAAALGELAGTWSLPGAAVAAAEKDRVYDAQGRQLHRGPNSAWDTDCSHCGEHLEEVNLLMCNYCPRSWHRPCVGLTATPHGYWRCPACRAEDKEDATPARSVVRVASRATSAAHLGELRIREEQARAPLEAARAAAPGNRAVGPASGVPVAPRNPPPPSPPRPGCRTGLRTRGPNGRVRFARTAVFHPPPADGGSSSEDS
jgi:hypothetical protein